MSIAVSVYQLETRVKTRVQRSRGTGGDLQLCRQCASRSSTSHGSSGGVKLKLTDECFSEPCSAGTAASLSLPRRGKDSFEHEMLTGLLILAWVQ